MPCLEIKDVDCVLAPPDGALLLKDGAGLLNPDLFSEGFGNRGFTTVATATVAVATVATVAVAVAVVRVAHYLSSSQTLRL